MVQANAHLASSLSSVTNVGERHAHVDLTLQVKSKNECDTSTHDQTSIQLCKLHLPDGVSDCRHLTQQLLPDSRKQSQWRPVSLHVTDD